MIDKVKLKHLPLFLEEDVAMLQFLDIFEIRRGFLRKKRFLKSVDKALAIVDRLQNLDAKEVEENSECAIRRPSSIDEIPLIAMVEIQKFLNSDVSSLSFEFLFAEVIAMACFSSNFSSDFSTSSSLYLNFKNRILNQPLLHMLGLYNWVDKELRESDEKWSKLFAAVSIDDPEYLEAGGNKLQAFDVIKTISSLCVDFSVSYKEAWQLSYVLSQTNNLHKATRDRVQYDMMLIKEQKIKRNQKKNL